MDKYSQDLAICYARKSTNILVVGENTEGKLIHGTTERSAKHFIAGTDLPDKDRNKTLSEWGNDVIYASDPSAPHQAIMFGSGESKGKQGKRTLLQFQLKSGAKILDLSDEVTRRPKVNFNGGTENVEFKDRPNITDDMISWLHNRRQSKNLPYRDVSHYVDPNHPEFSTVEYLPLLKDYAKDRGYHAVKLHDETAILDRNAIHSARKLEPNQVERLKKQPRLRKPYAGGNLYSDFTSA